MRAIFDTCKCGHNIMELVDILTNFSFATTETAWLLVIKTVYTSRLMRYQTAKTFLRKTQKYSQL